METFYIVTCDDKPMSLGHYDNTPKAGVLTFGGDYASGFKSYASARRAVTRSRAYAENNGLPWNLRESWRCKILRVKVGQ